MIFSLVYWQETAIKSVAVILAWTRRWNASICASPSALMSAASASALAILRICVGS